MLERTVELQTTNEELEAFSYSASHDLRSPLHAIGGLAFVLRMDRDSMLSPKAGELLDRVGASVKTMERPIDDLIGLSKSSRQTIRIGRVDLSALAREIADALAQQHPGSTAQVQIAPGVVAQADPGLTRIVLHNLLSNAFKYSAKAAQPRIEFAAEHRDDGATEFFVRDNGAGFEMKDAQRLFRPFQRLHSHREYAGSGIGLATAARIVRRHSGRIWADSTPGQGATFRFALPDIGTHEQSPLAAASAT